MTGALDLPDSHPPGHVVAADAVPCGQTTEDGDVGMRG